MGRVTIFVANDVNSMKVKMAFERRRIPFVEINVEDHPSALLSLKAVSHTFLVPKVFFNTRFIGGIEATLKELKRWDNDKSYQNAFAAYQAEIADLADPQSKHLRIPHPSVSRLTLNKPKRITNPSPYVELPDGTSTTFWNVTEKIRGSISLSDYHQRNAIFKKTFSGKHALKIFLHAMKINEVQGQAFGNALLKAKVIRSITNDRKFVDKESSIYRLQGDSTPNVLNSYCSWPQVTSKEPREIMEGLVWLLTKIELGSLDAQGRLDYSKAVLHDKFPIFEEIVCELQAFDMGRLSDNEKLAFALNVYNLMLRYAFIKLGFFKSEADRAHFFANVRFNVGGLVFSFDEWKDGILRGNRKSPITGKEPFKGLDRRRRLVLSKDVDPRIHFALGDHAVVGSSCSLPFRIYTAGNIDQELEMAASVYCNDKCNIRAKGNMVKLPKALYMYRGDFSRARGAFGVYATVAQYLIGPAASAMVTGECTVKFATKYTIDNYTRQSVGIARYEKDSVQGDVTGMGAFMCRFKGGKTPANERKRLATLCGLNLLDTLPEDRFDRITARMKEEFGVPFVFLTLVDANRAWFKSIQWPLPGDIPHCVPRGVSLCGHTINVEPGDINLIEDALEHPLYKLSPCVYDGPKLRFYAGIPIAVPGSDNDGSLQTVATLSIGSQTPHKLTNAQIKRLHEYGADMKLELLRRDSVSTAPTESMSEEDLTDMYDDFDD
ncbi:hypothetical protein ACA910_013226 [Epithemia clementina (nom. ined.)]